MGCATSTELHHTIQARQKKLTIRKKSLIQGHNTKGCQTGFRQSTEKKEPHNLNHQFSVQIKATTKSEEFVLNVEFSLCFCKQDYYAMQTNFNLDV